MMLLTKNSFGTKWRASLRTACRTLAIGSILLAVVAGCGKPTAVRPAPTSTEQRQAYAELPGLRRSPQPWLQEEYSRLRGERALPLQIDRRMSGQENLVPTVSPAANLPTLKSPAGIQTPKADLKTLAAIYPRFSRQHLADQIDGIFPTREMQLGPAELTQAHEILGRKRNERRQFAEAFRHLDRLGIPTSEGLLANLEVLDTIEVGSRLEIIHAATLLADNTPDAAWESLVLVRHVAALCLAEGNYAARMLAAKLHRDIIQLVLAMHNHQQTSSTIREQVFESVLSDAANWPDDSILWMGERAVGLHTYELVRDGYFLSLLSDAEMAPLRERNILNVTARTALRNVDNDQTFYLQTMRRMVEATAMPYAERLNLASSMQAECESLRGTPQYPLVAGMILLTELENGIILQGEDKALWLALVTGLQQAHHVPRAEANVNPFTGEPFVMTVDDDSVQVECRWGREKKTLVLRRFPPTAVPLRTTRSQDRQSN